MNDQQVADLTAFLREHRSNEAHFEKLAARLASEPELPNREAVEEKARIYRKAKETAGSAWPEFEQFVTEAELALVEQSGSGS